jgi:hypothetical protein
MPPTTGTSSNQPRGTHVRPGAQRHRPLLATPAVTGDPGAPVQESNVRLVNNPPAYPGARFVFNVIDDTSASYTSAIRYVGFNNANNGSTSPLCGGGKASIVTNFGFGNLDKTVGPRNLAGSACRLYTP